MTKTVYPNKMVAHVWAQQTQPEGRSNNGNLWFTGDTIYSYRTPIARIIPVTGKERVKVGLVSSISYSITTSGKHLGPIYSAMNCDYRFAVPTLAENNEGRAYRLDHAENLAHLVEVYQRNAAQMMRARDLPGEYRVEQFAELHKAPIDYARLFKLKAPKLKTPEQYLAEIKEHHEKRNTPEAKAKRAKERAAREKALAAKAALQAQELSVRVKAWQEGKLSLGEVKLPRTGFGYGGPVYLRVKGENLETSMGATVPLAHAVKAFRFVKACKEAGREWSRNGHTIHVGHFSVDHIAADGTMKAGCHVIAWPQIEEAAKAAGVWGEAPSDAALEPSHHAA